MKNYLNSFVIAGISLVVLIVTLMIVVDMGKQAMETDSKRAVAGIQPFTVINSWKSTNGVVINGIATDGTNIYAATGYDGLIVFKLPSFTNIFSYSTNFPFNDVVFCRTEQSTSIFCSMGESNNTGGLISFLIQPDSTIVYSNIIEMPGINGTKLSLYTNKTESVMLLADETSGITGFDINWNTLGMAPDPRYTISAKSVRSMICNKEQCIVANRENGFSIYDLGKPNSLLSKTKADLSMAYSASISGNYLSVADRMTGIMIYDISDRMKPKLLGSYETPGDAYDVIMDGKTIYVADGVNGVLKLKYLPPVDFVLEKQFNDGSIAYSLNYSKITSNLIVSFGKDGIKILQ